MQDNPIVGHALVVGCLGTDHNGIDRNVHNVNGMVAMLRSRRFSVDVRTGERARRDGILAGYDELIATARADQPAVFYYTGHGFSAVATDSTYCQGICPTDIGENTDDDFRGITAWELSIKQALLTRRTRNVTAILDCCHASQMTRNSAASHAAPQALPHPIRKGIDPHLRALREKYGDASRAVDPLGNPHVVRVLACGQGQVASVYQIDGEYRTAFTEALLSVLGEVGDAQVSWAALESTLRARVFDRQPSQVPSIDGPARRRLFSLDDDDVVDSAVIFAVPDGFELRAGSLMGVRQGDIYAVMPPGSRTYQPEAAIAEVQVRASFATLSLAELRAWKNGHRALTQTAIAIPIQKSVVRRPVRLEVPADARDAIAAEIAATAELRVAGAEDTTALAKLRLAGGSLTIEDAFGPLYPPARFPDDWSDAISNLSNLAAAQRLRELGGSHRMPAGEVEVEWGTVEGGQARPMPESGASLGLGDKLYVKVKSNASKKRYVHIFNIGLRGKITLLTKNLSAMGVELHGHGAEFVLGHHGRTLQGVTLAWPSELADSFPRVDEVVVIVSAMPAALQYLETQERIVARRGDTRSFMEMHDVYFMKRLSYLLHPRKAAMADLSFELDDDPLRQLGMLAPDAWIDPSSYVARRASSSVALSLRLKDLIIDRQCDVGPAVRFDALICTRSAHEAAACTTWTRRYRCDGGAGDRVGDTAVVFRGPVHDFVGFYLWASRDTPGSPDLSDLLARRADNPALRDAIGALVSRNVAVAAAVGGGAALARIASDLLHGIDATSRRLFRTALDAHSGFGLDRHAATTYAARGVSFSLAVSAEPAGA